jgi:WD40 repeat protein
MINDNDTEFGTQGWRCERAIPRLTANHQLIDININAQETKMENKSAQAQSPATPIYILRGHGAPIHALHIYNQNLRLVSGDANGWIVIWDLVTKRPVTVWKAHAGAVLEVKGFNLDSGITEIYT